MVIDPPKINRARVLKEERARQRALEVLQQILLDLAPDEGLGTPVRQGAWIVIPIDRLEE